MVRFAAVILAFVASSTALSADGSLQSPRDNPESAAAETKPQSQKEANSPQDQTKLLDALIEMTKEIQLVAEEAKKTAPQDQNQNQNQKPEENKKP
ncbi:hypothetical protein QQS21_000540 [Conoideocrella luteorostrata]|uniref:Secreted protein n=1 Tax=Conoideocrella luteorostrata TaxID=1105319 RepID=A0AAJ0CYN4_9HYPO|nr:hypothetical protein QQS21_000540 [Conoideocrella luteorostrata]